MFVLQNNEFEELDLDEEQDNTEEESGSVSGGEGVQDCVLHSN